MTIGIYCIKSLVDGKRYIGQSTNIERRWRDHKYLLDGGRTINKHFERAWKKYGRSNFEFSILLECEVEKLDEIEKYYINEYQTMNPNKGYNLESGGNVGRTFSLETRKKMSEKMKLRVVSPETRKKISESLFGHKRNLGKTRTEEYKISLSKRLLGHFVSSETKKKMSESQKGNTNARGTKHTKQSIDNMVNGRKNKSGWVCKEETKKKISKKNKGRKPSSEVYKNQLEGIKRYWENKKSTEG